jgi:NADPH-dependent 2,4-dienoyl-CoA reductase/sulfur reductase-like enzyme
MTQDSVKHFDYLMVGGGTVAGFAAKGIREVDKDGTIGIISSENDSPYTRPALTKKYGQMMTLQKKMFPFIPKRQVQRFFFRLLLSL